MMLQITKAIASLTLGVVLFAPVIAPASPGGSFQRRGTVSQRRRRVRTDPARERREQTFQLVWETVKNEHFDPTFGGVDWDAVRLRYAPLVARVRSDQELHSLLQMMLNELPQSHFAIIPPEQIPRIKATKSRGEKAGEDGGAIEPLADEAENEGDNEIATRMLNGIGIDVRILNGQVVITRVATNGAAAKAGLRVGFVIKSIDDASLENLLNYPATEAALTPIMHMRLRQWILIDYLGGEQGTEVHLRYLDEQNQEHEVMLKRERLSGTLSPPFGNFPPLYTEFEAKRLPGEVGYVRFSVFTPQAAERICGAIKSMRDAPGLVIDLRGNPGGVMGMASGIVGMLTNKAGLIGVLRLRTGMIPIPTFPQRSAYKGALVVLIDRLSASTAEVMAAALQESGRAVIVGERSAGVVLGADIRKLPTGALFEFARTGFKTSQGAVLEGKGVAPDVLKKLDRNALLKGEDDQLEEALRQIALKKADAASQASTPTPPPPPPSVTVKSAPEPPAPVVIAQQSAQAGVNSFERKDSFKSSPQAESIMERYIKALGGREALERLTSRVSVGVCRLPFQDINGKVVIYEQAPNKRSLEMTLPNLGVMKIVFDGQRAWMQHPLEGFYEYDEPVVSALRREYDFYKITRYKEHYAEMNYKGAIDTAQGKVEILEVTARDGSMDELHFDAATGLLVYGDNAQLGDYRQVGDVKVPFLIRILFEGLEMTIQLEQVSLNAPISADAFKEPQSCFTEP
jgi:carboxyl-terminal processing protease